MLNFFFWRFKRFTTLAILAIFFTTQTQAQHDGYFLPSNWRDTVSRTDANSVKPDLQKKVVFNPQTYGNDTISDQIDSSVWLTIHVDLAELDSAWERASQYFEMPNPEGVEEFFFWFSPSAYEVFRETYTSENPELGVVIDSDGTARSFTELSIDFQKPVPDARLVFHWQKSQNKPVLLKKIKKE